MTGKEIVKKRKWQEERLCRPTAEQYSLTVVFRIDEWMNEWILTVEDFLLLLLFTFFDFQHLTGIDLDLHFPISLVFAEPAVAREHVLHPMNWYRDLHTVQEPSGSQALISVTNQETADLQALEDQMELGNTHTCLKYKLRSLWSVWTCLSDVKGFQGKDVSASRLKIVPEVIVGNCQYCLVSITLLPIQLDKHPGVWARPIHTARLDCYVVADILGGWKLAHYNNYIQHFHKVQPVFGLKCFYFCTY